MGEEEAPIVAPHHATAESTSSHVSKSAKSASYFKGAVNTIINNPIFNNIARDATILNFHGGESSYRR
jgi:hypothetical protein